MSADRHGTRGRPALDPLFLLFLGATALSFVRAEDQPSFDVSVQGTEVSIVPADLALLALAVWFLLELWRTRTLPRSAVPTAIAAGAFTAWVLGTALLNGSEATVSAVKLAGPAVLGLCAAVLVDGTDRLRFLLLLLTGVSALATVTALVGFAGSPGDRQASFLGEHDLAALSTMILALALVALVARPAGVSGVVAALAGVAGALGIVLGAALASLGALYLVVAAVLAIAAHRHVLALRPAVLVLLVTGLVTAGTLGLRSGELGFVNALLGDEPDRPGEYAASWSQRLIFAYIGGRIFLDHPIAGTGWHGLLPAEEFARYVPDARERFPDQPERYFPSQSGEFIPQQTYDQVLYQLGLVGAGLFLVLGGVTVASAARTSRVWPASASFELGAYVPAAWTASLVGALAGAGLFGGTALASIFWLTIGVVPAVAAVAQATASEP